MPLIGDRREAIAEFRNGEPIPGDVADQSVSVDARAASADGAPDRDGPQLVAIAPTIGSSQSFCAMTVDGSPDDRLHRDVGGSSDQSARLAGAACESASVFEATERLPAVGGPKARRCAGPGKRIGPMLVLWAILIADIQGLLWLSGVKTLALQQAVEQGVARAESYAVAETGDNQIHKAIGEQRATLRFWTILALIRDFVVEPIAPSARALAVATLLTAHWPPWPAARSASVSPWTNPPPCRATGCWAWRCKRRWYSPSGPPKSTPRWRCCCPRGPIGRQTGSP